MGHGRVQVIHNFLTEIEAEQGSIKAEKGRCLLYSVFATMLFIQDLEAILTAEVHLISMFHSGSATDVIKMMPFVNVFCAKTRSNLTIL
jgi:hypothetical protein